MVPYYQDDWVTIYHGRCEEVLPLIPEVDITFSSPPYNTIAPQSASGMMKETNRKQLNGYLTHADDMPEGNYKDWIVGVFSDCMKKSKGLVWINHKTRYRDKVGLHPLYLFPWPFYSEIVWDRGVSVTLNARKFAPSHEYLYGFGTPHWWDNSLNTKMSVWRINPERNQPDHPCPFPMEIVLPCISASCPKDGVVLDPFMGSGTTLRGAKELGRKAIGIEIEEKYCEIAANRMSQEVLSF